MAGQIRHIETALRFFAGDKALQVLSKELDRANCQRALILCGKSLSESSELDLVRRAAGDRLAGVCAEVRAHSPRSAVVAIAGKATDLEADALIAVGGGSAMVTARAVAIQIAERLPLDQLCTRKDTRGKMVTPRLDAPKMPIFALPTTPSTAVVKPGTAIFDETSQARLAMFDPKTRPRAIFLDAELLGTAPDALTQTAALNTLCSAAEGLASGTDDHMALAVLTHALRLCVKWMDQIGDPRARVELATAAVMCGRGTDHTGMGLATVVSHAVAKAYDVDGGIAKAAALPHVLRFNWDHIVRGRSSLGLALGCPEDEIIKTLTDLFSSHGIPARLRDLGVPSEGLQGIAAACLSDWFLRTNPRPVSQETELRDFLQDAW